jgi:hypothetical protein
MKTTILTIAILCLVILFLSRLANKFVRVINEQDEIQESDDVHYYPPIIENEQVTKETKEEVTTKISDEKVVLSVENDSSTSNPRKRKDYNDKQNLNDKYNKNTYRSKNGRYRSLKEVV